MLHWTVSEGVSTAVTALQGQKEAVKLLISASGSVWQRVPNVSAERGETQSEQQQRLLLFLLNSSF